LTAHYVTKRFTTEDIEDAEVFLLALFLRVPGVLRGGEL